MVATYNRQKKLNVRKAPLHDAEIVGAMHPGQTEEVEIIEDGWCKVGGGYIRADLVIVRLDGEPNEQRAPEDEGGAPDIEAPTDDGGIAEAFAEGEEAAAEQGDPADGEGAANPSNGEDAGELNSMTIPQLRELAVNSGIKIPSSIKKKDDIIAAILADD